MIIKKKKKKSLFRLGALSIYTPADVLYSAPLVADTQALTSHFTSLGAPVCKSETRNPHGLYYFFQGLG